MHPYQKRKDDIYEALKLQISICPGRDDLGHGFIQFIKCNPGMVHNFTELYTFYLNRVSRTANGVVLEVEDFLCESLDFKFFSRFFEVNNGKTFYRKRAL